VRPKADGKEPQARLRLTCGQSLATAVPPDSRQKKKVEKKGKKKRNGEKKKKKFQFKSLKRKTRKEVYRV